MGFRYRIGEISWPTRYFADASWIGFRKAGRYGIVGTGDVANY